MDPLSDIIALLRPSAAVSKPITARGDWGVRYAAHDAPGYTIILHGRCWLTVEGLAPLRLEQGDFVLLPTTPAFAIGSRPEVRGALREPTDAAIRHGDMIGDPDFVSLGGSFRIEPANAALLFALLPGLIHVPAAQGRAHRLGAIVELIVDECGADDPGRAAMLARLLEVLLIEALRRHGLESDAAKAGLLHGLRDPGLARALRAMHADVRGSWTVARLAQVAGLSRSSFAVRFRERLGCGPIEYLARWRMALAKDALMRGTSTLDSIADAIGYESASAFSTAFRKRHGCSPGRFARIGNGFASDDP